MHVRADTGLSMEEVQARLAGIGKIGSPAEAPGVSLDASRTPPKLFLESPSVTLPPAAEVALRPGAAGTSVVLRLMWGPLPAPLPRAVAAAGVLLALLVFALAPLSVVAVAAALLLAGAPVAALLHQRRGERRLQHEMSRLPGGPAFHPEAH